MKVKKSEKKYKDIKIDVNNGHIPPKCTSKSGNHDMKEYSWYGERHSICKICGVEIISSCD